MARESQAQVSVIWKVSGSRPASAYAEVEVIDTVQAGGTAKLADCKTLVDCSVAAAARLDNLVVET